MLIRDNLLNLPSQLFTFISVLVSQAFCDIFLGQSPSNLRKCHRINLSLSSKHTIHIHRTALMQLMTNYSVISALMACVS